MKDKHNIKSQINWDKKLIELSSSAMNGILASKRYYTVSTQYHISSYSYMSNKNLAKLSIEMAKELIEQLKNELASDK